MLSINPKMLPRLDELETDLLTRRQRAIDEGWRGEVEGLDLTLKFLPPGLLARAICAVTDGTCSPERGRSDNGHLDNCIGLRNSPGHAR